MICMHLSRYKGMHCFVHHGQKSIRIKSDNFGHQVNSDIYLQTVEIQMRRLLMSRLIRIFTACLVNFFFHSNDQNMKQTFTPVITFRFTMVLCLNMVV